MTDTRIVFEIKMLMSIAESILEVHVHWCGSPMNPLYPHHNPACKASAERVNHQESKDESRTA